MAVSLHRGTVVARGADRTCGRVVVDAGRDVPWSGVCRGRYVDVDRHEPHAEPLPVAERRERRLRPIASRVAAHGSCEPVLNGLRSAESRYDHVDGAGRGPPGSARGLSGASSRRRGMRGARGFTWNA